MQDVPENELFSAYLDGELTAEEQAEVEKLLATSPSARQLLDELRALSATLQSLPVEKPGGDMSERVLRLAERRILSEPAPSQPAPGHGAGRLWGRAILRRLLKPRNLLWPLVAAAVALMIWFVEQSEHVQRGAADRRRVAMEVQIEAPAAGGAESAAAPASRPPNVSAGPAEEVAEPTPEQPRGSAPEEEAAGVEMWRTEAAAPRTESAERPAAPLDLGIGGRDASLRRATAEQAQASAGPRPAVARKAAPMAAPAAPQPSIMAEKRQVPEIEAMEAEPDTTAADRAPAPQLAAQLAEQPAKGGLPLVVVRCQLTAGAAIEGLFPRILAEQNLKAGRAPSARRTVASGERLGKMGPPRQPSGELPDHVEIVATATQIEALMQKLWAHRDEIFVVEPVSFQRPGAEASEQAYEQSGSTQPSAGFGGFVARADRGERPQGAGQQAEAWKRMPSDLRRALRWGSRSEEKGIRQQAAADQSAGRAEPEAEEPLAEELAKPLGRAMMAAEPSRSRSVTARGGEAGEERKPIPQAQPEPRYVVRFLLEIGRPEAAAADAKPVAGEMPGPARSPAAAATDPAGPLPAAAAPAKER